MKWYNDSSDIVSWKTFLGTTKNRLVVGHGSDGTGGPRRPPGPSKRNMEKIYSNRIVNAFVNWSISFFLFFLFLLLSLFYYFHLYTLKVF